MFETNITWIKLLIAYNDKLDDKNFYYIIYNKI